MAESYEGMASLSEIQINEEHWGRGAEPIVMEWLGKNYDPSTMPKLQVATVTGREGLWLLGWNHADTDYPPLLELIFGEAYAQVQLDQTQALAREHAARGVSCPRCGVGRYTPYGRKWEPGDPAPPALSRTDNQTYICSDCGQNEAMEDLIEGRLTPQSDWPLILPGTFGQGRA